MIQKLLVIALIGQFTLIQIQAFGPPLQLNPEEETRIYPHHNVIPRPKGLLRERLPKSVVPIHYKIDLIPILDPTDPDFKKAPGEVSIRVKCVAATSTITMHMNEIVIEEGAIKVTNTESGEDIPVTSFSEDTSKETLEIVLGTSLTVDTEYDVHIVFVARVADDRLNGLYLSQYNDTETGITNYHAATQFEDIGARKAFPCWDEPAIKATFEIRLGRKEGFHTLWSMPKTESIAMENREGYFWDVYPSIPVKMSTYLMAIVSSDFEEETAPEGLYTKPVKIWGPIPLMKSSDHGKFAAEVAAKVLAFFETYLNHTYDFPKMDSVAVPMFSAGAMENYGLNLYRTQYLLFTEGETTQAQKWSMASVLAHELAHQWWGNLVTMRWWNDIWLNEGFANYMQFHGSQSAAPQFTPAMRVNTDTLQNALNFDAGPQSTQIHMTNEEDVVNAPSAIIYDKGASVIRMMQGFLTENTLITGLRKYLKDKEYDNAVQDELFSHLTEQAHEDGTLAQEITVKQIMDTWTLQAGFPIVRVSRAGPNRIYLSQRKFLNDPKVAPDDTTWFVPIPWVTKANPDVTVDTLAPKVWIPSDAALISADVETTDEWILVNPDGKGFYRVLYDDHLAGLLKGQLDADHNVISVLSRGQILDDYFKIAMSEKVSINKALEFTNFLNKERELAVWIPAVNNLRPLLTKLTDSAEYGAKFNAYLLTKIEEPLQSIGLEPVVDESPVVTILRTHLLDFACALGSEHCYTTAVDLVRKWMADETTNPIMADFQPSLYCAAVWSGGDEIWNFMLKKYSESTVTVRQQSLLLNSLACHSHEDFLIDFWVKIITTEQIREADASTLLQKIAENKIARDAILLFIQEETPIILESRVGENGIRSIVTGLATYFNTVERHEQMTKYLEENQELFSEGLITSINASIATIKANIDWLEVHGPGIGDFFGIK